MPITAGGVVMALLYILVALLSGVFSYSCLENQMFDFLSARCWDQRRRFSRADEPNLFFADVRLPQPRSARATDSMEPAMWFACLTTGRHAYVH